MAPAFVELRWQMLIFILSLSDPTDTCLLCLPLARPLQGGMRRKSMENMHYSRVCSPNFSVVEPSVIRRNRKVGHMQNMISFVEVIAKAYKLLIRLAGIITSEDSPANAINGTRKVTVIDIKIAIKGNIGR